MGSSITSGCVREGRDLRPAGLPEKNALLGSETVLIVEDDERVRDLVRQVLQGLGYHVLAAEAGDREVDDFLAGVADFSPNGRIAEPGEIASLALFLASDAGRHITGTAIPIDGGLTA